MDKVKVARAERLYRLCKSIIDNPDSVSGNTKAELKTAVLKYASTLYDDPERVLKALYRSEGALGTLVRKAVEVAQQHDGGDDADGGDHDAEPIRVSDHHASVVANLLVEAGSHPDRVTALGHLMHSKQGRSLLRHMSIHKGESDMKDSIQKLVDDIGVVGIAKGIIAGGKGYGISEHELTGLITDHAKRLYPSDRADTAFAKVVTAQTEDGFALRKALEVAKTTDYSMVVSVIGGQDAMDMVTDPKKAMEELVVIGRLKWPEERTDVQFARAIQDPANAELAARAHQRPMPTTNYPFPV